LPGLITQNLAKIGSSKH